jgi:SWI/SNF-related matrix-associated actin-dependent regulator of chromatin subfamily A3
MKLEAVNYWCLTGTPIANRIEDLGALLQFCRVPLLEDKVVFRNTIVKPVTLSLAKGDARASTILRRMLGPICLRRTKGILPQARSDTCIVELTDVERAEYKNLFELSKQAIDAAVNGTAKSIKRHTILQAILGLRIFCNHGASSAAKTADEDDQRDPDEEFALRQQNDEAQCIECGSDIPLMNQFEDSSSGSLGTCGHVLCQSCLQNYSPASNARSFFCPLCDEQTELQRLGGGKESGVRNPIGAVKGSAKLTRLVDNLASVEDGNKR